MPVLPIMASVRTVWLVNQFFGAGPAPTGPLLEGLAVGLAAAGDDVTVLTGRGAYNRSAASTAVRFAGRVRRLFSVPLRPRGVVGRALSWLTFYLAVFWFAFTRRRPDQVVVMTTPPFLHVPFVLRNLLGRRRTQIVVWNQDTYPEILAAAGLVRERSLVYRGLLAWERFGMRRVDAAVALDESMRAILERHGAPRVRVVPNWVRDESAASVPARLEPENEALREALTRAQSFGSVVAHIGNYGWGHDLSVLRTYFEQRPESRDFCFVFVGGGEKFSDLLAWRDSLRPAGLAVLPYVSESDLAVLLARAHWGLVTLEAPCVGLLAPSKIHTYLAAGLPLLYVGAPGSNVHEAIDRFDCGVHVAPDDAGAFLACLERLAIPAFDRDRLVRHARSAVRERYVESAGVRELLSLLHEQGARADT